MVTDTTPTNHDVSTHFALFTKNPRWRKGDEPKNEFAGKLFEVNRYTGRNDFTGKTALIDRFSHLHLVDMPTQAGLYGVKITHAPENGQVVYVRLIEELTSQTIVTNVPMVHQAVALPRLPSWTLQGETYYMEDYLDRIPEDLHKRLSEGVDTLENIQVPNEFLSVCAWHSFSKGYDADVQKFGFLLGAHTFVGRGFKGLLPLENLYEMAQEGWAHTRIYDLLKKEQTSWDRSVWNHLLHEKILTGEVDLNGVLDLAIMWIDAQPATARFEFMEGSSDYVSCGCETSIKLTKGDRKTLRETGMVTCTCTECGERGKVFIGNIEPQPTTNAKPTLKSLAKELEEAWV